MNCNKLYYGDNFDILKEHIEDSSVDLIYIDPPFNSRRDYNIIYEGATAQAEAFKDTWSLKSWQEEKDLVFFHEAQRYSKIHTIIDCFEKLLINTNPSLFGYLVNMSIRIVELRRVLKDTGSFYLHCDPAASHYLKIILDEVFGVKNFRNEITWCYRGAGYPKKDFGKRHDTIFRYSKTNDYIFNLDEVREEYAEATKERFKHYVGNIRKEKNYGVQSLNPLGKQPDDWWQIQPIAPSAKERLGYPTQKPEALLEQIIKASCPENGVVLDAYCGCGTSIAVAQRLKRKWIGIDITFLSIDLIRQRLFDSFYIKGLDKLDIEKAKKQFNEEITIFGIPKDIESARQLAAKTKNDRVRKEFEKWAVFSVGGVYFEKKGSDGGIDGYFYIPEQKDNKSVKTKCLIQVKSGKVSVSDIREFNHVLDRENSPVGIFVALENLTQPMLDEVNKLPKYQTAFGIHEKIYMVKIEDILNEKLSHLPVMRATKQAEATIEENTQQLNLL